MTAIMLILIVAMVLLGSIAYTLAVLPELYVALFLTLMLTHPRFAAWVGRWFERQTAREPGSSEEGGGR